MSSAPMPVLLDGGLSNALADRGHDLAGVQWTARLLREAPAEIAAVHEAYYRAGARVATTASYQAGPELLAESVRLARRVRDGLAGDGVERWVAASVGPYGAMLADGSEYRGRYGVSPATLRSFHAERIELLAAAGPDLLAVETIPDLDEAAVLVELIAAAGVPAWLSYTVDGNRTRAGQPLAEAFAVAAGIDTIAAVGVNCCAPADVLPAVRLAVEVTGRPGVAYPNRGESWDAAGRRWQGSGAFDPQLARDWTAAGAGFVGGCCRVGPTDIAAMADALSMTTRDRDRRPV